MSVGQTQLGKFQMPQVGDTLEGRYRIDAVLATGGMGVILRAHHMRMGREVAVKILHPHIAQNDDVLARFEREVRLAQRLNHPNTIRLYDYGEAENGLIYVVMEMLDGADLKEVLASEGTLSVARAVDLTLQVLDGLGEAHEQDFVHRDIKPSNLFLCTDRRGDDQIKILDFGIAKSLEETASEITKTGSICGTAAYVAPEYLHDPKPQKSADVYAVGLILLELITGKRAFHGTTTAQTLMMQLQREIQVPRALANTALGEVIARATQKEPAQRYRDADAMFHALEAVVDQIPADLRLDSQQVGEVLRPLSDASMTAPGSAGPAPVGATQGNDSSSSLPRPDSTPASGEFAPSSDALAEGRLPEVTPDNGMHDQKTLVTPQPSAFNTPQEVSVPPNPSLRQTKGGGERGDSSLGKRLAMVAVALLVAAGGSVAAWSLLGGNDAEDAAPSETEAPAIPVAGDDEPSPEGDQPAEADRGAPAGELAEDELAREDEPADGDEMFVESPEEAASAGSEESDDEAADQAAEQEEEAAQDEAVKEEAARKEAEKREAARREAARKEAARKEARERESAKKTAARPKTRTPKEREPSKENTSSDKEEENVDEFLDEYL